MIDLAVVTPKGRYLEQKTAAIHAASVEGEFTLLPNHMPVVMSLKPCKMVLTDERDHKHDYAISGGILHFDSGKATLLTDAIEGRAEIDVPRAQKALERAKAHLEKHGSDDEMKKASLALQRALNRIHVASDK